MKKIITLAFFFIISSFLIGMCSNAKALSNVEEESNDYSSLANEIVINESITGNLSDKNDADWYKFSVDKSGYFNITFNHVLLDTTNTKWWMDLYDSNSENTGASSSKFASNKVVGNENLTTIDYGVSSGTYYIKIDYQGTLPFNSYSGEEYSIKVTFIEITDGEFWETENNNSYSSANSVDANKVINGAILEYNDDDWFKFEAEKAGYFNVTLTCSPYNNVMLSLYSSDHSTGIDGSQSVYRMSSDIIESKSFGIKPSTYYICITYNGSSLGFEESNYKLKINYTIAEDYEGENNSSKSNASLMKNNVKYNAWLSSKNDEDWFRIDHDGTNYFLVIFNYYGEHSADTLWYMYIYDSNDKQLMKVNIKGNDERIAKSIYETDGTFYVKITKASNDTYTNAVYNIMYCKQHVCDYELHELTPATCYDEGRGLNKCKICGANYYTDIPVLNHEFELAQGSIASTCTDKGKNVWKCVNCDLSWKEITDALGHDYVLINDAKSSTIFTEGIEEYECSRCGDHYVKRDKSKSWIFPVIIGVELIALAGFYFIRRRMKE